MKYLFKMDIKACTYISIKGFIKSKKMKTYYIGLLLGVLFLSACQKDFLDRQPESDISPDAFFRTEKDLELYTNSFYNVLPSAEGVYNEDIDNVVKQSLSDEIRGTRVIPVSGGGWDWEELRKINYFMANYNRTVPEDKAKPYVGIARFFRAWFYFNKVRRFGDVPWYSKVIEEGDETALTQPRDPRTLVMDSIMADIDYAIANLPTGKSVEKVNKWTALALKSRIALFEGTFRKYHTEFALPDYERFLTEAAAAAGTLIAEGPYVLFQTTPDKSYLELFAAVNSDENEVILTRRFSDALQIWHNVNYYTITSSYGRPGLEKQLVNSYLMKDGSRFTDKAGYETMQFYQEVQDRDPRLSQTIRTPGYQRIGGAAEEVPQFGASMTGYQVIKFVGDVKYDSYNRSENDMPVFRLGEAMLNYAEAKAELGDVAQADLDLSINKLRERVEMPGINLAAANIAPDPYLAAQYLQVNGANKGLILEVRRERRIELVMESFRWDDLMRWKEGHLLTKQFKGMYFPGLGSYDFNNDGNADVQIYTGTKPTGSIQFLKLGTDVSLEKGEGGGNVVVNEKIDKKFDENRDYLYPIPIQERQLNPNLSQNPGWNDGL